MSGVQVRVKIAGTYTDEDFRAIVPPSKKGDIITTASGAHVDWLRERGLVTLLTEREQAESDQTEALEAELADLDEALEALDNDESSEASEEEPKPVRRGGRAKKLA